MPIQGILYIAGVSLLIVAVICAIAAAWMFFKKNVRDVHDDLTGKKRAKTIAEMDELAPVGKRLQRQSYTPTGAAVEVAASVARHAANSIEMEDVQVTASPKPKVEDVSEPENTAPEPEAPETVIEEDIGETIIGVNGEVVEEDATTVEGVDAQVSSEKEGWIKQDGITSISVVRKIVLADSCDFVKLGERGVTDA